MKNFISIMVMLCIAIASSMAQITPAATEYAGGTGTTSDPYQINDIAQLRLLSETKTHWDKSFVLNADIDAYETALWNDGKGFSPIGDYTVQFSGTFNGKGHAIKGIYINKSGGMYLGLFGQSKAVLIDSVTMTDFYIYGYQYIGGLVGKQIKPADTTCTISNCYANGYIGNYGKDSYLGGLIGAMGEGTVSNCQVSIEIKSVYNNPEKIGGLVGEAGSLSGLATIVNCNTYGVFNISNGASKSGGLVGVATSCNISQSSASVKIWTNMSKKDLGGLVGEFVSGSVKNSYANGSIMCVDRGGGLIGYCHSGVDVSQCIANSDFHYWGYDDAVGGLVIGSNESNNIHWLYYNLAYAATDIFYGIGNYPVHPNVKGLTAEEFTDSTKFGTFNFDSIWEIRKEFTSQYTQPYLKSNKEFFNKTITITLISDEVNGSIGENDTLVYTAKIGEPINLVTYPNKGFYPVYKDYGGSKLGTGESFTLRPYHDSRVYVSFEYKQYDVSLKLNSDFKNGQWVDTDGTAKDKISKSNLNYNDSLIFGTLPADSTYKCFGFNYSTGYIFAIDNKLQLTDGYNNYTYTLYASFAKKQVNDTTPNYIVSSYKPDKGQVKDKLRIVAKGSQVNMVPIPDSKYRLGKWVDPNGNTVSADSIFKLTVYSDTIITPVFIPQTMNKVTFTVNNAELGTLVGETCQFIADSDSITEVLAIPANGCHFVQWENLNGDSIANTNPLVLDSITKDYKFIAVFEINSYEVHIQVEGNGSLSINDIVFTDTTFNANFNQVLPVITASAQNGNVFVNWKSANNQVISSATQLENFAITSDTSIIAVFAEETYYAVTFTTDDNGSISGEANQSVLAGQNTTKVSAVPNNGYEFTEWQSNGAKYSTDNPLVVENVSADMAIKAIFKKTVGLSDAGNNSIIVFPNPCTNKVQIQSNDEVLNYEVISLSGTILCQANCNKTNEIINLSYLKNGIYFIKIYTNKGLSIFKIVKE